MSYAELYEDHHGEVRALARRLVRDEAEADDVTAATFEALPRAMANYEGASEVRSFVFGVCANLARRVVRSRARRHAAIERFAAEPIAGAQADDPETLTARRELLARLARALEDLPDEQRTAFLLTSIEERSAAEVAALCNVPEATVRTRLFHARRKLREALSLPPSVAQRLVAVCAVLVLACALGTSAWAEIAHPGALRALARRVSDAIHRVMPVAAPRSSLRPPARDERSVEPRTPVSALTAVEALASVPAPAELSPRTAHDAREPAPSHRARDPFGREPLALFARAHDLHFRARDYDRALRAWEAYLATAPRGHMALEARYNRAIALARLRRFDQARRALGPFAHGDYGDYRRADAGTLLAAMPE